MKSEKKMMETQNAEPVQVNLTLRTQSGPEFLLRSCRVAFVSSFTDLYSKTKILEGFIVHRTTIAGVQNYRWPVGHRKKLEFSGFLCHPAIAPRSHTGLRKSFLTRGNIFQFSNRKN